MTTFRTPLFLAVGLLVTTPLLMGREAELLTSLQIGTVSLIALSFGIAYGLGGLLSAAQATFAAAGAYATAIATVHYGWPIWAGLALAIALPTVLGAILVRLIGGLSHMTLGLATLIIGELFTALVAQGGDFTGSYLGLIGVPFLPQPLGSPLGAHLLVWGSVLVVVACYANLVHAPLGATLRTVGHEPVLARSFGTPVERQLSALFAVSSAIAGYAGWLYAHTNAYVSPESLPVSLSVTVFLMVIVGGTQAVSGPLIGAIGLSLLSNHLPGTQTRGMLYGAILIVVILAFPKGVAGIRWPALGRKRHLDTAGAR